MKYDFSGWATKNNLLCSDGRTIMKDAFKDNDGMTVPLVWNHQHNDPDNVLGHALLENRDEGMYAYCSFNDTERGQNARRIVEHGDVKELSIYANKLRQRNGNVMHGCIREVSLVLAGANPGAFIDAVMSHSEEIDDGEGTIFTGEPIELRHADGAGEKAPKNEDETVAHADEKEDDGETVQDVLDTLTEKQKDVVYALIAMALKGEDVKHADSSDDEEGGDGETIKDIFDTFTDKQKNVVYALIGQALENDKKQGGNDMKHNVFESDVQTEENVLTHSDMTAIIEDGKRIGSLREAMKRFSEDKGIDEETLQHSITSIGDLFPDAHNLNTPPEFITRDMGWVSKVMNSVHHTPFSRVKTMQADLTADEARAKGYIKGHQKVDEVFTLLKRSTPPTTIYKLQKLDRDDVLDITDFDVVAWLKREMRMMLEEEIARAVLVGDGRSGSSDDKINEGNVRPIWTDTEDEVYTIPKSITVGQNDTDDDKAKNFIRACVKARKDYRGTGSPTLFCTEDLLTDMLLLTDETGRDLYDSVDKLATKLRVKEIVTVPVMENRTRTAESVTYTLAGIIVNLADYNIGADKGGNINLFDDFDIDYNKQKYLIETRISGALIKPKSAIALEFVPAGN